MKQESIYNIIEQEQQILNSRGRVVNKPEPTFQKKQPVLPTGSTFIHNTTFRPNVTNI